MTKRAPKAAEAYLYDILEACRLVLGYTQGLAYEEFIGNSEKQDAVIFRLDLIARSATRIAPTVARDLPTINFTALQKMRRRLARGYGAIDHKIVWTVILELATIASAIEGYFKSRE